jgi:hypothetical protein
MGNWKLLVDSDHHLLFDLARDIGERNDLASARPELVLKLSRLLDEWEKDVDSEAKRMN